MSDRFTDQAHCQARRTFLLPAMVAVVSAVAWVGQATGGTAATRGLPAGLTLVAEYGFRALESEVAGIHPHPTDDALFLVATNSHPAYRAGQQPLLAESDRGKLLFINRHSGDVVRAIALPRGNHGGLAFDGRSLYVSQLEPPQLLEVDLGTGVIRRRIPISGPAGGLEYDGAQGRVLAQLYLSHPHLAVIDPSTGSMVGSLWSDESAMDLARVSGDLLCTWVSSFDEHAFGELRRIDTQTGRVTGRLRLPEVHTSMAALDRSVAGLEGFISLVRENTASGRVVIRRYAYDKSAVRW